MRFQQTINMKGVGDDPWRFDKIPGIFIEVLRRIWGKTNEGSQDYDLVLQVVLGKGLNFIAPTWEKQTVPLHV